MHTQIWNYTLKIKTTISYLELNFLQILMPVSDFLEKPLLWVGYPATLLHTNWTPRQKVSSQCFQSRCNLPCRFLLEYTDFIQASKTKQSLYKSLKDSKSLLQYRCLYFSKYNIFLLFKAINYFPLVILPLSTILQLLWDFIKHAH